MYKKATEKNLAQSRLKHLPKMKSIAVVALFAVVVAGNTLPGVELGHFVQRSAIIPIKPASTPEEICTGVNGYRCGDCSTMLLCLPGGIAPQKTNCPANMPYCHSLENTCKSTVPADGSCGDDLTDPNFTCSMPDEFFPHPTNCSLFYECVGGQAYLGECNPNQVYTTNGMACKTKVYSADCGTFKCNVKTSYGKIMPYSTNNAYFAYCGTPDASGNQQIVVLKCEYVNEYYSTDTGLCEFQCKDAKLYADAHDPNSYYDCYKVGSKFAYDHKLCTLNRSFDEASQSCV